MGELMELSIQLSYCWVGYQVEFRPIRCLLLRWLQLLLELSIWLLVITCRQRQKFLMWLKNRKGSFMKSGIFLMRKKMKSLRFTPRKGILWKIVFASLISLRLTKVPLWTLCFCKSSDSSKSKTLSFQRNAG